MNLRSLAYRTDLMLAASDAEVVDRGPYVVVKTPGDPTFFWGNYLLFGRPPSHGDLDSWSALFRQEFENSAVSHRAMGWDSIEGELGVISPFLEAGYRPMVCDVMVAEKMDHSNGPPTGYSIRVIESDEDWMAVVRNHVLNRDPYYDAVDAEIHYARQCDRYRRMSKEGLGRWFGAFCGDELAGDLGIFGTAGVARYQFVCTHPSHRRRGICSSLVVHAGRFAILELRAEKLVIVAEEQGDAGRIYHRLGFLPVEKQVGMDLTVVDESERQKGRPPNPG